MAASTYTDERTSSVSAARLFKAFVTDSHNLYPKLLPHVCTSIDIQGDKGAGTIEHVTLAGGNLVKHHVHDLDEETYTYKYTLIDEHDTVLSKMGKITYELKFHDALEDDGRNIITKLVVTTTYYPKDEFEINDEDVKEYVEKGDEVFKLVEDYLHQNPDVYA